MSINPKKINAAVKFARILADNADFTGKRIAFVGGTAGLGAAGVNFASQKGGDIYVVGRTQKGDKPKNSAFIKADLSLMSEATRIGNELPTDLDAIFLTTGILAAKKRELSKEGLEMDMAVSTLSRHVILKTWLPRLAAQQQQTKSTRIPKIFIMGFPGAGQIGTLGDLNGERTYEPGFGKTHTNTVVGNEALVHFYAAITSSSSSSGPDARVFGLNPGLIKTEIRAVMHNNGFLGGIMESVINMLNPSPEEYARTYVPLMLCPELEQNKEAHNGAIFNQKGVCVMPTPGFTPDYVSQWIKELDALHSLAIANAATMK